MKKAFTKKATLCILTIIMVITMLQGISFAETANKPQEPEVQIIQRSNTEYLVYVPGLLNEKFEFAFSKSANTKKEDLVFTQSAIDKTENGNSIAYIEDATYVQNVEKAKTFLWVKQNETYKVQAQEINLAKALTESKIAELNLITKKIKVKVGEKQLPETTIDGVKITGKIGTLNITDSETAKYTYKIVKSTKGSDTEKFITIVNKMNQLDNGKNIVEQLAIYNQFKVAYENAMPEVNGKNWAEVKEFTIEQPQDLKKGDQYLVWIQKTEGNNAPVIDVQIMDCNDEYKEIREEQEVVVKQTSKLPITGDNIILFVIAGVILVLIIAVIALKLKNKKETK